MERVSFLASYVAPEKSWKLCIVCLSLFRIINNQIMKIEANNFTACNLTQKLVCLEDIEGGKFVVVYHASAESVTDKRFLQSLKKDTRVRSSRCCWPICAIVLLNQSIRQNPEPHCLQNKQGLFRKVLRRRRKIQSPSWKGSKIFGIFWKSSDINRIRNLKKLNNLTDLPLSICVNVWQMWIALFSSRKL